MTLGKTEASDLEAVCDYLREKRAVDRLGLWGRSMGAVASIFFSVKNPIVSGNEKDCILAPLIRMCASRFFFFYLLKIKILGKAVFRYVS